MCRRKGSCQPRLVKVSSATRMAAQRRAASGGRGCTGGGRSRARGGWLAGWLASPGTLDWTLSPPMHKQGKHVQGKLEQASAHP